MPSTDWSFDKDSKQRKKRILTRTEVSVVVKANHFAGREAISPPF